MPEGKGYGPQFTASTGLTLNYIGDHAYAFSGAIGSSTSGATMLNFTTGDEYIRGKFTSNPSTHYATVDSAPTTFQLSINGEVIGVVKFENNSSDTGGNYWIVNVIIPPHSTILLEMDSSSDDAAFVGTAIFEGQVYGKVD